MGALLGIENEHWTLALGPYKTAYPQILSGSITSSGGLGFVSLLLKNVRFLMRRTRTLPGHIKVLSAHYKMSSAKRVPYIFLNGTTTVALSLPFIATSLPLICGTREKMPSGKIYDISKAVSQHCDLGLFL